MGMNSMLMQVAVNIVKSDPSKANSPIGQQFLQIAQNGDEQAGIALAENLCQSYGTPKDQAIGMAQRFAQNSPLAAFLRK